MALGRTDAVTFHAGTIVTSDYLPWARVLADSFSEHNPRARFSVAVLDEPDPDDLRADDRFDLLRPVDLGLGGVEYGWMSVIYDALELSCAVKPWLLRALLADADAALYMDADMLVCDSLAMIGSCAAAAGVVLSPHLLEPPPADGRMPDEDKFLAVGQFNGGFIAVGREGTPFLDWWSRRLARACTQGGLHTSPRYLDQRWLDLVPSYFAAEVLRDRGVNVAYWNLSTRRLERGVRGYTVDGQPLRCMHFSGFDPATPGWLSKYQSAPPRVDPAHSPALRALCDDYAARLFEAGLPTDPRPRPVPELGGIPLAPPVRAALRHALIDAEQLDMTLVPDPRDTTALWSWLRAPVTPAGTSWYLWGLRRSDPELRNAFPNVPGPDEPRYLHWSATEGTSVGLVPSGLGGASDPLGLDTLASFVLLVEVEELLSEPAILSGVTEYFHPDELTVLIRAAGRDPATLASELDPLLAELGLGGPDAPELVRLLAPAAPAALAPVVDAVLTRRTPHPAFAPLPTASDAAAVRRLLDAGPAAAFRGSP